MRLVWCACLAVSFAALSLAASGDSARSAKPRFSQLEVRLQESYVARAIRIEDELVGSTPNIEPKEAKTSADFEIELSIRDLKGVISECRSHSVGEFDPTANLRAALGLDELAQARLDQLATNDPNRAADEREVVDALHRALADKIKAAVKLRRLASSPLIAKNAPGTPQPGSAAASTPLKHGTYSYTLEITGKGASDQFNPNPDQAGYVYTGKASSEFHLYFHVVIDVDTEARTVTLAGSTNGSSLASYMANGSASYEMSRMCNQKGVCTQYNSPPNSSYSCSYKNVQLFPYFGRVGFLSADNPNYAPGSPQEDYQKGSLPLTASAAMGWTPGSPGLSACSTPQKTGDLAAIGPEGSEVPGLSGSVSPSLTNECAAVFRLPLDELGKSFSYVFTLSNQKCGYPLDNGFTATTHYTVEMTYQG